MVELVFRERDAVRYGVYFLVENFKEVPIRFHYLREVFDGLRVIFLYWFFFIVFGKKQKRALLDGRPL